MSRSGPESTPSDDLLLPHIVEGLDFGYETFLPDNLHSLRR